MSRPAAWFPLAISRSAFGSYRHALGLEALDVGHSLAQAIAASPDWQRLPGSVVVVRPGLWPPVAIWAQTDTSTRAWLEAQIHFLEAACSHLRYISYERADSLCRRLAERVRAQLGDDLDRACFIAIPRGGHVVLGLLATALGIRADQLAPSDDPQRPLVVVDDCSLSGARFGNFLEQVPQRRVLFATLLSPPALRKEIERLEPRVEAVLSAADVAERTPLDSAERQRRMDELGDRRYWLGICETLAFPWGEPDQLVRVGRPVPAWHLLPPEFCLKTPPPRVAIQEQPRSGAGRWRPGAQVVFADLGERFAIGHLGSGSSFALEGVAADMWRGILHHGDLDAAAKELAARYEVAPKVLAADLKNFVDHLAGNDLLEKTSSPP